MPSSKNLVIQHNNLDPQRIPQHVAIVMDGNGRWAQQKFRPRNFGHKAGSEALRRTMKSCVELGIKYLTVYVFSTENWKRPAKEVSFLMNLLRVLIIKEVPALIKEGVSIHCLGAINELDANLQEQLRKAEAQTSTQTKLHVNLMINYGGRREIIDACKAFSQDCMAQKVQVEQLTEDVLNSYLYTKDCPEIDLFIRTGGDIRISNFLLWQLAYSELFFLDTLWPDFDKAKLVQVVQQFQSRERRFGGLKK